MDIEQEASVKTSKNLPCVERLQEQNDPYRAIQDLFHVYNFKYFYGRLQNVKVKYCEDLTWFAGMCNFSAADGTCTIHLSWPILKNRLHCDIVETLLHEMIHAYLFVTGVKEDHGRHGVEFLKNMNRINKEAGTSISIYHSFTDGPDINRFHWWKCDGPCQKWRPFHGILKRAVNKAPGRHTVWWTLHKSLCNGKFRKFKQPSSLKNTALKRKHESENTDEQITPKSSMELVQSSSKVLLPNQNLLDSVKNRNTEVQGPSYSGVSSVSTSHSALSKAPKVPYSCNQVIAGNGLTVNIFGNPSISVLNNYNMSLSNVTSQVSYSGDLNSVRRGDANPSVPGPSGISPLPNFNSVSRGNANLSVSGPSRISSFSNFSSVPRGNTNLSTPGSSGISSLLNNSGLLENARFQMPSSSNKSVISLTHSAYSENPGISSLPNFSSAPSGNTKTYIPNYAGSSFPHASASKHFLSVSGVNSGVRPLNLDSWMPKPTYVQANNPKAATMSTPTSAATAPATFLSSNSGMLSGLKRETDSTVATVGYTQSFVTDVKNIPQVLPTFPSSSSNRTSSANIDPHWGGNLNFHSRQESGYSGLGLGTNYNPPEDHVPDIPEDFFTGLEEGSSVNAQSGNMGNIQADATSLSDGPDFLARLFELYDPLNIVHRANADPNVPGPSGASMKSSTHSVSSKYPKMSTSSGLNLAPHRNIEVTTASRFGAPDYLTTLLDVYHPLNIDPNLPGPSGAPMIANTYSESLKYPKIPTSPDLNIDDDIRVLYEVNTGRKWIDPVKVENSSLSEHKEKQKQECIPEGEYKNLLALSDHDIVSNVEDFECPICFSEVKIGLGVTLQDCLHSFCKECLASLVEHSETAEVQCPFTNDEYACESHLQDREIRSIVTVKVYERHLQKSLTLAENQAQQTFHCLTPDCPSWCFYENDVNFFKCPLCNHINCITCSAIHEGLNCHQYQADLEFKSDTDESAKKTRDYLQNMLNEGEAMRCPRCQIILMKKYGCDALTCTMCQLQICWATKGPRWGPKGVGDTSGGCRCKVDGRPCHPSCKYCH